MMESFAEGITRIARTLQYPLDNPDQTLVAVLVLVVAGLLLAVVLIALASPGRRSQDTDAPHAAPGSRTGSPPE